MPDFRIEYEHMGQLYSVAIQAQNLDDAEARLESLKATGELDDGTGEWLEGGDRD
jgi:hypothetical protein